MPPDEMIMPAMLLDPAIAGAESPRLENKQIIVAADDNLGSGRERYLQIPPFYTSR